MLFVADNYLGLMWKVYVISSLTSGKLYVGMTEDTIRRLIEHNAGRSKFTSGHTPWKLIYSEEIGQDINEARKREKYLKSAAGKRFLKRKVTGSPPD